MKIIDKTTTNLLAHTVSGDYDTYEGWKEQLIDDEKSIDDCIISGHEAGEDGLVWTDEEAFAQDVLCCCNKRGEWQVDTYVDGQVEVDDGVDAATGIHRVHLEDDKMLAYVDHVSLSDITPNSCNANIQYKVTVVFDHDQEDYAKDDDGNIVAEDLDWDNPYMIIIEELQSPVGGPMSTRCILMSIRREWWQEIAAGRKVLEFRSRFPADYRGKVYVYESGKDSRHAVVGSFRVDYVIDADKARASRHEDWEILDRLNGDQLNDFFERKYHAEGSLYAIHVTDVVADGAPMSLEDFGALLDKPVIRAPQSWQYINI